MFRGTFARMEFLRTTGAELTYLHAVNVFIEYPSLQHSGESSEHDHTRGRRFPSGAASLGRRKR